MPTSDPPAGAFAAWMEHRPVRPKWLHDQLVAARAEVIGDGHGDWTEQGARHEAWRQVVGEGDAAT